MTALVLAASPLSRRYWPIRSCSTFLTEGSITGLEDYYGTSAAVRVYDRNMSPRRARSLVLPAAALCAVAALAPVSAQFADSFVASRDNPAIAYSTTEVSNRLTRLNQQMAEGKARLAFEPRSGYLRAVLDALNSPAESQVTTFAKNSFQTDL